MHIMWCFMVGWTGNLTGKDKNLAVNSFGQHLGKHHFEDRQGDKGKTLRTHTRETCWEVGMCV
jgi:hypothetical protein